MPRHSPAARARENLTAIVSVLVTATWLAALLTGRSWWLAVMVVGYVAIVPIVAVLFGDVDDRAVWGSDVATAKNRPNQPTDRTTDPNRTEVLQTLRDRYARGELTEEQFERKLETLLETETLEDVKGRDSIVSTGASQATATESPAADSATPATSSDSGRSSRNEADDQATETERET